MMEMLRGIFGWNYILSVSLSSWLVAQLLKTIINAVMLGKIDIERMWGSGGMPSAHSATACSMVVATGKYSGVHSSVFAVAFVVAVIVMYDAMNVRRETGEQSKILNQMIRQWMDEGSKHAPILADHKLKELVGHTPVEVLSGAAVGICMGLMIPIL